MRENCLVCERLKFWIRPSGNTIWFAAEPAFWLMSPASAVTPPMAESLGGPAASMVKPALAYRPSTMPA